MAHPPNISKTQVVWCLSHISERTKTFRGEILRLFPNESSTICGNFIHDDEWSNDQLSFTQRCDHSSYDKFAILPEKNFPEPGATVISPDYEPERKMLVAESQFPGALRKLEWIRIKKGPRGLFPFPFRIRAMPPWFRPDTRLLFCQTEGRMDIQTHLIRSSLRGDLKSTYEFFFSPGNHRNLVALHVKWRHFRLAALSRQRNAAHRTLKRSFSLVLGILDIYLHFMQNDVIPASRRSAVRKTPRPER